MLGLRTGCLMLALYLIQSVEGATEQTGPLKMTTRPAKLVATPSSPRLQDFLAAFELKSGTETADRDYFDRMVAADDVFENDQFLNPLELELAREVVERLRDVEAFVGHGRFTTLNFEAVFKHSAGLASRRLTVADIRFLRDIFNRSSESLGFNGPRISNQFLAGHAQEALIFYPKYGEYLLSGDAIEQFERLEAEFGSSVMLTSGYRGHPKQMLLYLEKVVEAQGNLSLASRNRAPAGYSFHFIGDFDVGDVALGEQSFSRRFLKTSIYQSMVRAGWVKWRYPSHNLLGVRFEPWHIASVCDEIACSGG